MKIMMTVSKPITGLAIYGDNEAVRGWAEEHGKDPERLSLFLWRSSYEEGNPKLYFRLSETSQGPEAIAWGSFLCYEESKSDRYRACPRIPDNKNRNAEGYKDSFPELGTFGPMDFVVEVDSRGDFSITLPEESERPTARRLRRITKRRRPMNLQQKGPRTQSRKNKTTRTQPASEKVPERGTAAVRISFAGHDLSFNLPAGDAFELAVQLTSQGYKED